MTKRSQPTDAQIVAAFQSCGGIVTAAAQKVGMERAHLHRRIAKSEKLKAALADVRESVIDLAETSLLKALQRGEGWATCFFLKCQAKHRGYVERSEISGPDGGPIVLSAFEKMSDDELRRIADGEEGQNQIGTG